MLEIAGTREDAERAANEWGVRIRLIDELENEEEVYAVCPAADVKEITAWHAECMPRMQEREKPRPGDPLRIEQPPEDVDTDFTEVKKPRPKDRGHHHRPLKITNPRLIKADKL